MNIEATHKKKSSNQENLKNQGSDNLPKGWEIKKFENCLEKVVYTTKIPKKEFLLEGDYPIISQEKDFINGYWNNDEDLFRIKKPIVIFGDHTQVKKYVDFDFVLGADGVKIFQTKNEIDPKYFFYYLQNIELQNLGYARHYRLLKEIEISYPKSLPEQQRIVSLLDKAFAAIDKAKANAEKNLKNAKEMFESFLNEKLKVENGEWEEKRFDEVCVLQRGFDLPTHSRFKGGFPLVSSNGITDYINEYKIKTPGVVTGRSGTIGNVHFIEKDFWPLNTALYIKDFHGNDERFIYYFLIAFDLNKYSSGAGVPTLNRNNVHSIMVRIPKSLKEQQTIVHQLDALRAETQKLEAVYQQKIVDLEELKKSILELALSPAEGKAFSGQLKMEKAVAV